MSYQSSRTACLLGLGLIVGCAFSLGCIYSVPENSPEPARTDAGTDIKTERQPESGESDQDMPGSTEASQTNQAKDAQTQLPGITIHRERGYIDLAGKVVTRDGQWLELLACSPGTREYESILTVQAKPSHIHFALLLLGLMPGSPYRFKQVDGEYQRFAPQGPKVAVTLRYQQNDQTKTVPANRWVVNQTNDQVMKGNHWLFTGSRLAQRQDKRVYVADPTGNVISLVNFGDDVLARSTTTTNDNDNKAWTTRTKVIPDKGTPVTVRLKPVKPVKPGDGQEKE